MFAVHEPKLAGRVAYRYALQVSNDWLQLTRATGVRGSVYAATEVACATAVTGLLTSLNLGEPVRDGYVVDREYESGVNVTALVKYDFEAEYQTKLAGDAGVIECSVSESVRYSAVRWIEQPLPRTSSGNGGVSILQDGGILPGQRQVRGTVTAATAAVAQAWARRQRALLTGDLNGNQYRLPEELETSYEFAPRVDGVVSGTGANVRLTRVSFGFGEVLPWYPAEG